MDSLADVKGSSQFVNLPEEVCVGSMKVLAVLIPTPRPMAGMNLQISGMLVSEEEM